MGLTRRDLMTGALGGALGAAGMYELVDRLAVAQPARRRAPLVRGAREQHIFDAPVSGERGLRIVIPPRHHAVATARVDTGSLRDSQRSFEARLRRVERRPGLGVTVAWGLPYFRRHVPHQAQRHLPFDHRAGAGVRALADAVRFASDPAGTVLETNDVAVLLRSDTRADIDAALRELFTSDFAPTSVRRGFVGEGLPKRMAVAAGVGGADSIPEDAQLFLGFTSTEESTMAAGKIANLETLGHSDGGPEGYFTAGTTMHLSHLSVELEAWYSRGSVLTRGRSIGAPAARAARRRRACTSSPSWRQAATSTACARRWSRRARACRSAPRTGRTSSSRRASTARSRLRRSRTRSRRGSRSPA